MEYSKQTRDDLLSLRGELLKQINELQKRILAIDVILPELAIAAKAAREEAPEGRKPELVAPVKVAISIRGLKQMPALKAIARANNGIVRTNDAKDLMMNAGVMKRSKNAYKMVYNLVKNSDEFQSTGNPGEYRLIEAQLALQ